MRHNCHIVTVQTFSLFNIIITIITLSLYTHWASSKSSSSPLPPSQHWTPYVDGRTFVKWSSSPKREAIIGFLALPCYNAICELVFVKRTVISLLNCTLALPWPLGTSLAGLDWEKNCGGLLNSITLEDGAWLTGPQQLSRKIGSSLKRSCCGNKLRRTHLVQTWQPPRWRALTIIA